jgi:hypothetical protein
MWSVLDLGSLGREGLREARVHGGPRRTARGLSNGRMGLLCQTKVLGRREPQSCCCYPGRVSERGPGGLRGQPGQVTQALCEEGAMGELRAGCDIAAGRNRQASRQAGLQG